MGSWIRFIIFINDDRSILNIELGTTYTCNMFDNCIILASEASQKKIDNNKANTTVGPPLSFPSNLYIRPHL